MFFFFLYTDAYLFSKQRLQFLLVEEAVSVCIWNTREAQIEILKKKKSQIKTKGHPFILWEVSAKTKKVTVQVEERFGVEIVGVETVRLLPHLLQLILTALKNQNTRHAKRKSQTRSLELA